MSLGQLAIVLETFSFLLVTIDLIGERRLIAWQARSRRVVYHLVAKALKLQDQAISEAQVNGSGRDIRTGGNLVGGGIDTSGPIPYRHLLPIEELVPTWSAIIATAAIYTIDANRLPWGIARLAALSFGTILSVYLLIGTLALPIWRILALLLLVKILAVVNYLMGRFHLSGYMLWTGSVIFLISQYIQFRLAA